MKRDNTPSTGASKVSPSPGLILVGTNVWLKREKKSSPDSSVEAATGAPKPTWNRYADSRLKQFHCR